MVTTHVELYEALKPHLGTEAAAMIADVVPAASNLATREDLHALRADIFRWGLAALIPVWVGVWGSMLVLIIDSFKG